MQTVREALAPWWKTNQAQVRSRCAPAKIDEQELNGYVLADCFGRPLLSNELGQPRLVGKYAYNAYHKVQVMQNEIFCDKKVSVVYVDP